MFTFLSHRHQSSFSYLSAPIAISCPDATSSVKLFSHQRRNRPLKILASSSRSPSSIQGFRSGSLRLKSQRREHLQHLQFTRWRIRQRRQVRHTQPETGMSCLFRERILHIETTPPQMRLQRSSCELLQHCDLDPHPPQPKLVHLFDVIRKLAEIRKLQRRDRPSR